MGKYKVRVNSEAESREIQSILESKGFKKWEGWSELGSIGGFIWTDSDMTYCDNKIEYFDESPRKEITLPELRAMVNPMKEYLDQKRNYEFVLSTEKDDGFIEVPEGADYYAKDSNNGFNGEFFFRLRSDGFNYGAIYLEGKWMNAAFSVDGQDVLWKREKQPKELSFVDVESINDQYAEIEQVRQAIKPYGNDSEHAVDAISYDPDGVNIKHERQHQHYFIDVSDVDEIDFYEIALRYNVTDPCIQHILKKCLAVGQRGQKDFHHDLKDIHDTAKRMLDVHGLNS